MKVPECDLLLLMPTHQAPAIDYNVGQRLAIAVEGSPKPTAVAVIGKDPLAGKIHGEFMSKGVPSFPTPERGVRALAAAASYAKLRAGTTTPRELRRKPSRFARRRGPLETQEASRLLRSYGIEEPKSVVMRSPKDFGKLARLEYPVACKLLSGGPLHKTDVGGVLLDVSDADGAKSAFFRFRKSAEKKGARFEGMHVQMMVGKSVELILGGTRDPTFGPVVVYGLGGIYTEVLRDYVLEVAPTSPEDVMASLSQGRLGKILGGYRGGPKADINRLADAISSFSRIMPENPRIDQMEINPLMVNEKGVLAVDVRVILGDD